MTEQNDSEKRKTNNNNNDEHFFESLDRFLSSSSCSTSASDDDNNANDSPTDDGCILRRRNPFPVPKFPMGASKFDVWISEPISVSERRSRLLQEMGLSRDPSLSREVTLDSGIGGVSDFGRSVSSGRLRGESSADSGSVGSTIFRSKSDGRRQNCNCYSSSCSVSRSILSVVVNNDCVDHRCGRHGNDDNSVVGSVAGAAALFDKRLLSRLNVSFGCNSSGGAEEVVECGEVGRGELSERVCTIKNLDNGKEFVVNEIQEDGTWKKLREVGTGRQLTMEEFEMCVGHSPIVQELMRRQSVEDAARESTDSNSNAAGSGVSKFKKKVGWLKSIRSVASSVTGTKERRSSDDRDTSSEKGGRRSSSATDDSQDASFHGPERVKVRQYGKSCKELTALYKSQEIQAHNGSIWSIKFSLDGRYLASAGEDCVIHIWQVVETERKGELLLDRPELLLMANGSPEPFSLSPRRRGRTSISRKSLSLENIIVPDTVFGLSEKPVCSFQGHLDDVLDLSWSKSQHLLSSSMDKTVRLWHLSSQTCLKVFSHSDYVTCIQFNPVDDRYFISGSLDAKIRIWSIPDRQVVDWYDLHEMVTAACYTPDGQGALVGSYKGSCRVYNTADNKLQQKSQINLQNRKKRSHQKKITGFQFVPGSLSEVLITSADSRIRAVDGIDLVYKFKGFRNTNSQISASLTADGKYVVSASEDSHVYIWKYEAASRPSRTKGVTVTNSYEHFHCQDVSVAIPWPGMADTWGNRDSYPGDQHTFDNSTLDEVSIANHPPTPVNEPNPNDNGFRSSPRNGIISNATNGYFFDRISATWPEEKLLAARNRSPLVSMDISNGLSPNMSAWGMVIVTAGLRGEIRTFQNFGLPVRI